MPTAVLHLIETGGPGGAERMLVHLATGLSPVYCSRAALLRDAWLADALRRGGVPVQTLRYAADGAPARLRSVATLQDLLRLVRREQIALLHTHEFFMNLLGLVVSRITGVPQVATVHGKNYYGDRLRRRLAYRALARGAGALVAVSEDIRAFLRDRVGAAGARLRVIPNGVPIPEPVCAATRTTLRRAIGLGADAKVVITVASLYPVKGHVHLLDAAREIASRFPQVHFLLVGGGGLRDHLEARARELGLTAHVRFLGHRDDVRDLLTLSDVFVLPSLSEGTPLALLEALATGLPCVASRVGGVGAVVENETSGLLVPPADSRALATAIRQVLEDEAGARRMGAAGRTVVRERFSLTQMVREYEDLYELLRLQPHGAGAHACVR